MTFSESGINVWAMTGFQVLPPQNFEVTEAGRSRKGILIESNHELVVIGVNRINNGSYPYMASFLAIPVESLGLSYFAVTARDRAEILIVAGYANTTVTVKVNGMLSHEGTTFQTGGSFTSTLNEFDTLLLLGRSTDNSLTGTHVTSNTVVSVYSGNKYMSIGSSNHMVQQLVPVQAWRSLHVTVPPTATTYELMFVAAYPNTSVRVTCVHESPIGFMLNVAGSSTSMYLEDAPCVTVSSKPVSVTMFVRSQLFDPVMIRIQPLQTQSHKIVFLVKPDDIDAELVLVSAAGNEISLDDINLVLKPIPGTKYRFLIVSVIIGSHIINCSQRCQISAYIHGHHGMEATGYPIHAIVSTLYIWLE
ncbi:IgGFc-binding protein-like [Mizuhopecten yessoensis]|nr:IgGFc-binding protein-like [Mizuhopecten yessoensis]